MSLGPGSSHFRVSRPLSRAGANSLTDFLQAYFQALLRKTVQGWPDLRCGNLNSLVIAILIAKAMFVLIRGLWRHIYPPFASTVFIVEPWLRRRLRTKD